MSFSFYVKVASVPSPADIEAGLADQRLVMDRDDDLPDPWPEGHCLHPYLRGASIRGIEVSHEDGTAQVRIFTTSSRADYELGLRFVEVIAALSGATTVEPEASGEVPLSELRASHGDAWMDHMVPWGGDILVRMVEKDQKTLTFSGCRRDVHVGPR